MAIKSKKINEAILDEAKKIANAKMRGLKESYDDADDADYGDDVQDDDLDSGETKDLKAMAESSAKSVFKDGYMVDMDGDEVVVSLDPEMYFFVMESTYGDGKPCYVGFYGPMITLRPANGADDDSEYDSISNLTFESYVILDKDTLEMVGSSDDDDKDEILDVEFEGFDLYTLKTDDECPDSCAIKTQADLDDSFEDFLSFLCVNDSYPVLTQINYEEDIKPSDVDELDGKTGEKIGDAITDYLSGKGGDNGFDTDDAGDDYDDDDDDDLKSGVLDSEGNDVDEDDIKESVSTRFSRYRHLFENDDVEDVSEKDGGESSADGDGNKDGDGSDEGDDEDKVLTAIVITVKKDDADKCKQEMIDAGIAEEDIEMLDGDDDEDKQLKVDANSVMELKDYLKGKGIDLEEKVGGTIETDDDSIGGDGQGEEEDNDGKDVLSDDDFDDLFGDNSASGDGTADQGGDSK